MKNIYTTKNSHIFVGFVEESDLNEIKKHNFYLTYKTIKESLVENIGEFDRKQLSFSPLKNLFPKIDNIPVITELEFIDIIESKKIKWEFEIVAEWFKKDLTERENESNRLENIKLKEKDPFITPGWLKRENNTYDSFYYTVNSRTIEDIIISLEKRLNKFGLPAITKDDIVLHTHFEGCYRGFSLMYEDEKENVGS